MKMPDALESFKFDTIYGHYSGSRHSDKRKQIKTLRRNVMSQR